jgi:hypothetical protein
MNTNFYDALYHAEIGMSAKMTSFSKIFAPIEDHSVLEKLILDFVGLGFGMLAAPLWNIGMTICLMLGHLSADLFQA